MKTTKGDGRPARRTRAQWSALIKQYGESMQTQTAFCASRGLPVSSFTSALRRAREDGVDATSPSGFASVMVERVEPLTSSSVWDVELTLGAGIVLRIRGV